MERFAETWGDNICGAIASHAPALLRCSHAEALSYIGLAAMVVITVLALVSIIVVTIR